MPTIQITRAVPFHVGFLFDSVLSALELSSGYTFTHNVFELKSVGRKDVFIRYTPSKVVGKSKGYRKAVESEDAELIVWRSNSFKMQEDTVTVLKVIEDIYADVVVTVVSEDGELLTAKEYLEGTQR